MTETTTYTATVWNFGRDVNGNTIAHWRVNETRHNEHAERISQCIGRSGRRRQQLVGGRYADWPRAYLQEHTGRAWRAVLVEGSRAEDFIRFRFEPAD